VDDPADGLPLDEVGLWVVEKHDRLRKYVDISRGARRKFLPPSGSGGASYIDLYCGCGRAIVRDSGLIIDGSPLVAFRSARAGRARFSEIHLVDLDPSKCNAAAARIAKIGGAAQQYVGAAADMVDRVVQSLNPYGLHFAFLDPFNLQDLPFSVIEALGKLQRMDMLIHVSAQDLQRNLDEYTKPGDMRLERFVPGWRSAVDLRQSQRMIRARLLEFWLQKITSLGLSPAGGIELVSGEKNQRLYWLVFVSRSEFANKLWDQIRTSSGQRQLL
jgi:three-Cys-motif partner protein